MEFKFKTFNSKEEIFEFLNENKQAIIDANVEQSGQYALPVFASPITDDPYVMQEFHRWFDLETNSSLGYIVRVHVPKLMGVPLNLYKFKILCEYRGPLNEEDFVNDTVYKDPYIEEIKIIAKHPDFPQAGRDYMYEIHEDVDYLTSEAKDIFVF